MTNFRIKKHFADETDPNFRQSIHEKSPWFKCFFCSIIFPRKEMRHKSGSAYILQTKSPSTSWPRLNYQVLFIPRRCRLQVHYQPTEWKCMKTGFFLQLSVWRTPPSASRRSASTPEASLSRCFLLRVRMRPNFPSLSRHTGHDLSSTHPFQFTLSAYHPTLRNQYWHCAVKEAKTSEMVPTEITMKTYFLKCDAVKFGTQAPTCRRKCCHHLDTTCRTSPTLKKDTVRSSESLVPICPAS
jgi:hypothetical protein